MACYNFDQHSLIIMEPLNFCGLSIFRYQMHIIKYGLLNIFVWHIHVYRCVHLPLVDNDAQRTGFEACTGRVLHGPSLKILFEDNLKQDSNQTIEFHQPRMKRDTFQLEPKT